MNNKLLVCFLASFLLLSGCGGDSGTVGNASDPSVAKQVEEQRKAAEAKKAEEARQAEERRKAEEATRAELEKRKGLLIVPFGTIAWNQSLLEVTDKISSMPGIKKMALSLAGRAQTDLNDADEKTVLDKVSGLISTLNSGRPDSVSLKKFRDREGTSLRYPPWEFALVAGSVNIKGVPFKIRVQFAYAPGIAIEKPDFLIEDSVSDYALPLVVSKVALLSKSKALQSAQADIAKLLSNKYKDYMQFTPSWDEKHIGTLLVIDGQGNRIEVRSRKGSFSILYTGVAEQKRLAKVYKKHEAKVVAKEAAAKSNDLSSGL